MNNATNHSDYWNELALSLNETDDSLDLTAESETPKRKKTSSRKGSVKKTVVKNEENVSGESPSDSDDLSASQSVPVKKTKKTSSRKKTAKTTQTSINLLQEENAEQEKIDLTVGTESSKSSGRRSASKLSEAELIRQADRMEKEKTKSAQRKKTVSPLSALVSQLDEISQPGVSENDGDSSRKKSVSPKVAAPKSSEKTTSNDFFNFDANSSDFSVDDFFSDSNAVLDVSWGKKSSPKESNLDDACEKARPQQDVPQKSQPEKFNRNGERSSKSVDSEKAEFGKRRDEISERRASDDRSFSKRNQDGKNRPSFETLNNVVEESESFDCFAESSANAPSDERSGKRRRRRKRGGQRDNRSPETPNSIKNDSALAILPSEPATVVEPSEAIDSVLLAFNNKNDLNLSLRVEPESEILADSVAVEKVSRHSRRMEKQRPNQRESRNSNADELERPTESNVSDDRSENAPKSYLSWNDAISQVIQFNLSRHSQRKENRRKN